ncbi:hypothetical protein NDU88_001669 [Pleurodeles waltl]|uniref:Uncharacterized protein n=1 Tax=Pleurodeles waltl TaxID=8319 RepID=A0AAV7Q4Z9_PLEWA|nr:hypothetical protein NDU88_001669 [Pleurodeles waltl]
MAAPVRGKPETVRADERSKSSPVRIWGRACLSAKVYTGAVYGRLLQVGAPLRRDERVPARGGRACGGRALRMLAPLGPGLALVNVEGKRTPCTNERKKYLCEDGFQELGRCRWDQREVQARTCTEPAEFSTVCLRHLLALKRNQ